MPKTLRTLTKEGWNTKPAADIAENRLSAGEVDQNFLDVEMEDIRVISTDTTAVHAAFYIVTASLTLTLPASPAPGDWVRVSNRSGTTTGTIARNGRNIMGLAEDMLLDVLNAGVTLTYADATQGWVIT